MKVALIHDWLTNMGGSEKVVLQLHKIFPDAPVYTSIYNEKKMDKSFRDIDVRTSFLQNIPFSKQNYQLYLPFMPLAFEQFDLREFDLIISSNHSCSKGILQSPHSMHICYCHTPMRYAWSGFHEYQEREQMGLLKKILMQPMLHYLRIWDRQSADRVDHFIANSSEVALRIQKYYRRDSYVINPPVKMPDDDLNTSDKGYYLIVSRLVAYKRVDLAVEAFNRMEKRLIIVGDGPEYKRLKELAGPNIQFLGRLSDEQVTEYYKGCKAFLFPGEEDFGITPVEAQSFGKPVIAYGRGGVLDTVVHGKTGLFFYEQSITSLLNSIQDCEAHHFEPKVIKQHAKSFSEEIFRHKIKSFIDSLLK